MLLLMAVLDMESGMVLYNWMMWAVLEQNLRYWNATTGQLMTVAILKMLEFAAATVRSIKYWSCIPFKTLIPYIGF